MLADDFRRECSGQIRVSLLRHDGTHGLHFGMIPGLVPKADQIVEVRELQCLVVHRRIRFRRRRSLRRILLTCGTCTVFAGIDRQILEILSAVTVYTLEPAGLEPSTNIHFDSCDTLINWSSNRALELFKDTPKALESVNKKTFLRSQNFDTDNKLLRKLGAYITS